jgi:hypothetical protein
LRMHKPYSKLPVTAYPWEGGRKRRLWGLFFHRAEGL